MYVVNGLLFHIQNSLYMLTRWYISNVVLGWGWGSAPCELQRVWLLLKILRVQTLFGARLAYNFAKSANMTPKNVSQNIFNMGIKKRRIWCRFRTVEKVSRKFTQRKLEGWELLYTVLKDEKVPNFFTFMLVTFLYEFFYTFNGFEISIQFCVF